jgi:hypothetical protein
MHTYRESAREKEERERERERRAHTHTHTNTNLVLRHELQLLCLRSERALSLRQVACV